jgi:hypothetical protein
MFSALLSPLAGDPSNAAPAAMVPLFPDATARGNADEQIFIFAPAGLILRSGVFAASRRMKAEMLSYGGLAPA